MFARRPRLYGCRVSGPRIPDFGMILAGRNHRNHVSSRCRGTCALPLADRPHIGVTKPLWRGIRCSPIRTYCATRCSERVGCASMSLAGSRRRGPPNALRHRRGTEHGAAGCCANLPWCATPRGDCRLARCPGDTTSPTAHSLLRRPTGWSLPSTGSRPSGPATKVTDLRHALNVGGNRSGRRAGGRR